ncbi:MAG: Uma2 family endonuclease [Anaerolineae bacterium]|nr:Uma2 family endonuclease [Anaerolineae bacterium]MDQ7036265.1 Uma2 family endonuclease [Anaerolineae bacterium]
MMIQERINTVEEFEAFTELPENADSLFEFIGGGIFEVPSNPAVSKIAMMIGALLLTFVQKHKLGHITGEAGGYIVSGERYAPDVAFISYEKQPELAGSGYNPNPPDLAVEVISSNRSDEHDKLRIKMTNYLAAGTVVWVVKPDNKEVEVHVSGEAVKIYRENDTISGDKVLPNFELKVADIFQK